MDSKTHLWILLYLSISFIWFIVAIFIGLLKASSFFWLGVFIISTLLYIPIAIYYANQQESTKILTSLIWTLGVFLIYLIYSTTRIVLEFSAK